MKLIHNKKKIVYNIYTKTQNFYIKGMFKVVLCTWYTLGIICMLNLMQMYVIFVYLLYFFSFFLVNTL